MSTTTHEGDLLLGGALYAGNMEQGTVRIFPEANVPTSIDVFGINLRGTGGINLQLTAATTVPGNRVAVPGGKVISESEIQVWVHRTNEISTVVHWQVWRS